LKEGYIEYFISGVPVRATPKELEVVQVFSRILVEDFSYPKENIQTRPQWRVKSRPSDIKKEYTKEYTVDIAVFRNEKKETDNELIIVECKKPNRKDGRSQLEDVLDFLKLKS
jgi:type I restriction enzyme M protein